MPCPDSIPMFLLLRYGILIFCHKIFCEIGFQVPSQLKINTARTEENLSSVSASLADSTCHQTCTVWLWWIHSEERHQYHENKGPENAGALPYMDCSGLWVKASHPLLFSSSFLKGWKRLGDCFEWHCSHHIWTPVGCLVHFLNCWRRNTGDKLLL